MTLSRHRPHSQALLSEPDPGRWGAHTDTAFRYRMESVHLTRSLAGVVLSSFVLAAALFATPAAAAPPAVHLGQAGSESTTAYATAAGGCECTVAQFGDAGPAADSYTIPYDGVITASAFYLGQTIEAGNTVQVQTAHPTGATTGTVAGEGTAHGLLGLTPSAVHAFAERVPARAGDVLAARFHSSYYIQTTPYFFKTAAPSDLAAVAGPTAAGGSFTTSGSPTAERRLNLEAVLEPDEDHDGYGDTSQDLCPGSPTATEACSGSLYGSDLQGERSASPPACGSGGCMEVQTTIGGASTAAPSGGVVVRWRVLNAESGPYTLRVVSFLPGSSGGVYRTYRVLHSSATESVTAPAGPLFSKISSFQTRLPIPAGAYLGLGKPSLHNFGFQASGGSATYSEVGNVGDGLAASGETHDGTFLYDADVEPDVDGDGYGDVTQDSCPTSAAIHEGPCPVGMIPGGEGTSTPVGTGQTPITSTPADPARPVKIGSLAVKPKSFHAQPLGRVRAGGSWGTEVKFSLSSAATVTFVIEARHGRRFHVVTRLSAESAAGRNSVHLSGRYRHSGKVTDLAPGTYRLTAGAKSGAGTGPVRRTSFTVLPPARGAPERRPAPG